jgi:hypothetical protein
MRMAKLENVFCCFPPRYLQHPADQFRTTHKIQDFLQFSLREPQTITKNLALIVYDTTVPGIRNRDVFLQKISDVCCCPEPPLREPRLLVLLQSSRWDRIQDADVAKLKSSCNAGLLRIAKLEHGKLGSMDFPTELMITYVSTHVQETPLCQRLRESNIAPHLLDPHFRNANLVLHQLGPCAADLVLRNAFSYSDWADGDLHSQEEAAQAQVRDLVRHWPFRLPNLDLSSQNMNVSHKFHLLVQQLEAQHTLGTDFRGIVFGESDEPTPGCYNININIYSPETDRRSIIGRFNSKLDATIAVLTSSVFDKSSRLLRF